MLKSKELIAQFRDLAHQERNGGGDKSLVAARLSSVGLELAQRHEILLAQALAAESSIHELVKKLEKAGIE